MWRFILLRRNVWHEIVSVYYCTKHTNQQNQLSTFSKSKQGFSDSICKYFNTDLTINFYEIYSFENNLIITFLGGVAMLSCWRTTVHHLDETSTVFLVCLVLHEPSERYGMSHRSGLPFSVWVQRGTRPCGTLRPLHCGACLLYTSDAADERK